MTFSHTLTSCLFSKVSIQPPTCGDVQWPPLASMAHSAFFYGTLMAPQVLKRVIDHPTMPSATSTLTTLPAILPNHRRHRVRDADYPAILPTSPVHGHSVRGTFVRGLSDADIWRLDTFEGSEYSRVKVRVRVQDQDSGEMSLDHEEAETYVWIAGRSRLEDDEWDFDDFVKDKMWRWAETSDEYREVDEAVGKRQQHEIDPTGGRAVSGAFAAALRREESGTVAQENSKP